MVEDNCQPCAGAQNACGFGVPACWLSDADSMQYHRIHEVFGGFSCCLIVANLAIWCKE